MDFSTHNFRNASAILSQRPEWEELRGVVQGITRDDIIATQERLMKSRGQSPAGAQTAVNLLFEERLPTPAWAHQCRLFEGGDPSTEQALARWTMDFVKRGEAPEDSLEPDFGLGIEVAFNHAEAIAWTLIRLDLASEVGVREQARIDVGVAIYASRSFKAWGKMDGAVGTFEQACIWLNLMRPVMPIPIVLIGLNPRDSADAEDWENPTVFRGTRQGR